VNGTASGTDYTLLGNQAFIPAGSSTVTLVVTPIPDSVPESNETVHLRLTTNTWMTVGSPSSATVTIVGP
jgi:hypothetical protein